MAAMALHCIDDRDYSGRRKRQNCDKAQVSVRFQRQHCQRKKGEVKEYAVGNLGGKPSLLHAMMIRWLSKLPNKKPARRRSEDRSQFIRGELASWEPCRIRGSGRVLRGERLRRARRSAR